MASSRGDGLNANTSSLSNRVFVTVGSTKFTRLVAEMLSKDVITALAEACAPQSPTLTIQFGTTPLADILTSQRSALVSEGAGSEETTFGGESGRLYAPMKFVATTPHRAMDIDKDRLTSSFRPPKGQQEDDEGEDEAEVEDVLSNDRFAATSPPKQFTFHVPVPSAQNAVTVELIDFVENLSSYLRASDVVISHAGSGTILDVLRTEPAVRPKLVVVPNESLMDNHQAELALALAKQNYLYATRIRETGDRRLPALLRAVFSLDERQVPRLSDFPPFVPGRFRSLVDAEMGFSSLGVRERE